MRNLGRILIVALLLLALPAGAALAQTTDGTVTVLHGIPGDGEVRRPRNVAGRRSNVLPYI